MRRRTRQRRSASSPAACSIPDASIPPSSAGSLPTPTPEPVRPPPQASTPPHDRVRASSLVSEAATPAAMFDMFLDLLRSLHGPNLLRLKGVVKLAETPASPIVVHGVQHILHPVVQLPS